MNQKQPLQKVNIHQLEEKFKSKKELYQFLLQDCSAFLPNLDSTNVYFFKQIIKGEKEVILYQPINFLSQYLNRKNVKISASPQIEGLTVYDFLEYAKRNPQLLNYLPDERDWVHLDKHWICDILYTVDTDGIQSMIDKAIKERKERLELKQNLNVSMRPEFVQALDKCLAFSDGRGKGINMLKDSSNRKRKFNELEEVKGEELQLKQNKQLYLQQQKRLKLNYAELEDEVIKLRDVAGIQQQVNQFGINNDNKENMEQ